jgi:hypothetical protein
MIMGEILYQIRVSEGEVNDYILGRISGMLDLCTYNGIKVKSGDVLQSDGCWIFNYELEYETYLKIRDYITICYPTLNFKYFKFINGTRVEA